MTRSGFLATMRTLRGTRKVLVLKNGKRLRLRPIQEFGASSRLVIAPDCKRFHFIEYDDIREVRPLAAAKRRRKAD